jgi:hypothetical protein
LTFLRFSGVTNVGLLTGFWLFLLFLGTFTFNGFETVGASLFDGKGAPSSRARTTRGGNKAKDRGGESAGAADGGGKDDQKWPQKGIREGMRACERERPEDRRLRDTSLRDTSHIMQFSNPIEKMMYVGQLAKVGGVQVELSGPVA